MKIIRSPQNLYKELNELKGKNKTIGFVPTMGALHEGHLSLIRAARKENDYLVVSIFVNPTQFGPKEDLKRYPRPIRKDLELCRKEKVDFIFYPAAVNLYPRGFSTFVTVEGLSDMLCGKFRPGHFKGVATIVTKLFNIIQPDNAYFGQKDAQQVIIIKQMVKDLNFAVKIKVMPIFREKDGLAMSSRNIFLSKSERQDALVLSKALNLAAMMIKNGARDARAIINKISQLIRKKKGAMVDYIAITDERSLRKIKKISGSCLIAMSVRFGKTRLIDNRKVHV